MTTVLVDYVSAAPQLRIVEGSEKKINVDEEAAENFEDIEYMATDEATFRSMMACFSPLSDVEMEQWVAVFHTYMSAYRSSPFCFSGPVTGEGEFRVFELVDEIPRTASHPTRFQLFWQDNRGECVGNGYAALLVHANDNHNNPTPTVLVYGAWADQAPAWAATNSVYEPLISAVRSALKAAGLEFGFEN